MKIEHFLFTAGLLMVIAFFAWGALNMDDPAKVQASGPDADSVLAETVKTVKKTELATPTLSQATPVPTIYVTPTLNEAATVAQINLEAANKNLQASGTQAAAIVEAANIDAQAGQRKSESDERLAAQAIVLQKLINDGKSIEAMMMSFALRRDEIHLAFERLEADKSGIWVEAAWAFGLVCLAGAMVFTALMRRSAPVAEPVKQVIHVDKPEGGTERVPAPPVQDYESFVDWVGAVVAGETVAVDFWEHAGMFVGNYRKVHTWLVRWKLIMRHPKTGKAVLNAKGEQVLVAWLVANPLPYNEKSARNAPLPSVHTESVRTEAEGEGSNELGSGL